MTTTSKERREVAAGLRELAHDNQGELGPMRMRHVMEEGTRILGTVGLPDYAHVLTRYADLIDPTCQVSSVETYCNELGQLDGWEFHLTCGHSVQRPYYEAPSYCPECGARVV